MSYPFNTSDTIPEEARSLGELFHENSKLHPYAGAKLGRRIGQLMENPYALRAMNRGFKTYPNVGVVKLPLVEAPNTPLAKVLKSRRSVLSGAPGRKFSNQPVAVTDVSVLLRECCGITETREFEMRGVRFAQRMRAFPSGGGLYPLEIYPILQNCDGAVAGVYHYNVLQHHLERLRDPLEGAELRCLSSFGDLLEEAPLIVAFTAVFPRTYFKYHERGYRFVLLEAGHLAENFYLVAGSLRLAVVAVGGFFDDVVNRTLAVDGVDEAAVYLLVFGHPPRKN